LLYTAPFPVSNAPWRVKSFMGMNAAFLEAPGGEAGCMRLSAEFYARVGQDPVLRPLFPGKSLRCATEEFAASSFNSWVAMKSKPSTDGG
jgi:truncated hemoglobin YjbI